MTIPGTPWLDQLLDATRPNLPSTELDLTQVIGRLKGELGAGEAATEIWEELTKDLRTPVVHRGYAYEWNIFRRVLCITRLPTLIDYERFAELYERSTPVELKKRIQELSGPQFESFLKNVLAAESFLTNVVITGQSHDGGIDFKALYTRDHILPPLRLIGQAKQTNAAVSAGKARDFVGALDTSGESKSVIGLYVCTAGFTDPALEAFSRSRFHVMTWNLGEVTKRAIAAGVGVKHASLNFTLLDDTFWDELGAKP